MIREIQTKPNELLAAIEQLKRNLPAIIEHSQIEAQIKKARYDAFIKEGFDAEQALRLVLGGMGI